MARGLASGVVLLTILVSATGEPRAASFDAAIAFQRAGGGIVVLERLGRARLVARVGAAPSCSADGRRLAYVAPGAGRRSDLRVVDAEGKNGARLTRTPRESELAADWSPEGRRLVVQRDRRLFVIDADGRRERLLTAGVKPVWSPRGSRIGFVSDRAGAAELYTIDADGRGLRRLTTLNASVSDPAWSADGSRLAFVAIDQLGQTDLYSVDVRIKQLLRLTQDPVVESSPAWSRNGTRVLFVGDRVNGGPLWSVPATGGVATPLGGPPALARFGLRPVLSRELRPDLDQRPPSDLSIQASAGRYLLGFTSASDNVGLGPVSIVASRPSRAVPTMRAAQRVRMVPRGAKTYPGIGLLRFTVAFPHLHWHLLDFQRYELRRASDHALVARDRKSGFCLADHWAQVRGSVPGKPHRPVFGSNCGQGQPGALAVSEGTSVGYTDRYPAYFHGQNLDVTRVPAGLYVLVHRANPELTLRELRYENNAASVLFRFTHPNGVPTVHVLARCPDSEWCRR